jgi:DNA-binding NarL/FixJ family response regulator
MFQELSIIFPQLLNSILSDKFQKLNILTPREKEIVKYIRMGHTTQDIANLVSVSFEAIKYHRKNIFNKLEITKVSQYHLLSKITDNRTL